MTAKTLNLLHMGAWFTRQMKSETCKASTYWYYRKSNTTRLYRVTIYVAQMYRLIGFWFTLCYRLCFNIELVFCKLFYNFCIICMSFKKQCIVHNLKSHKVNLQKWVYYLHRWWWRKRGQPIACQYFFHAKHTRADPTSVDKWPVTPLCPCA